jgi:hypothetical protein
VTRQQLGPMLEDAGAVALGVGFPAVFFGMAVPGLVQLDIAFAVAKWTGLGLIGFYGYWAARLAGAPVSRAVGHHDIETEESGGRRAAYGGADAHPVEPRRDGASDEDVVVGAALGTSAITSGRTAEWSSGQGATCCTDTMCRPSDWTTSRSSCS